MDKDWFFFWVRKYAQFSGTLAPLLERERPMERLIEAAGTSPHTGKHEVLIPLWQKAKPLPLLELTSVLTTGKAEPVINILNMILAPRQVPLENSSEGSSNHSAETNGALSEAIVKLAARGIFVNILHWAVRAMDLETIANIEAHSDIS